MRLSQTKNRSHHRNHQTKHKLQNGEENIQGTLYITGVLEDGSLTTDRGGAVKRAKRFFQKTILIIWGSGGRLDSTLGGQP